MKTPKLYHLAALIVVAITLFVFPIPAEGAGSIPEFYFTGPSQFTVYMGIYNDGWLTLQFCEGGTMAVNLNGQGAGGTVTGDFSFFGTIQSGTVVFSNPGTETLSSSSGACGGGAGSQKKVSHCADFSMPRIVPRSPAVRVSFKGPWTITSASIYFNDLGYRRSLWLYRYDWGSGRWYGFLNTLNLPLGRHNGRLTTYVDGVRGGGCAVGSFKVVNK